MSGDCGESGADGRARRGELVRHLARLEGELAETEAALRALGADELSGLHLVVEVAGRRAVLPASRVRTVLSLVTMERVPEASRDVLGAFVLHGAAVTVIDLARRLGVEREPALEAVIVVLGGQRAVGVLVDRVLAVEERLALVQGRPSADGDAPERPWHEARLVVGLCRWGEQVVPLLDLRSLLAPLEGSA